LNNKKERRRRKKKKKKGRRRQNKKKKKKRRKSSSYYDVYHLLGGDHTPHPKYEESMTRPTLQTPAPLEGRNFEWHLHPRVALLLENHRKISCV